MAGRTLTGAVVLLVGYFIAGCAAPAVSGQSLDRSRLTLVFDERFDRPLDRKRWRTFWFYGVPGELSSRRSESSERDIVVDDAFSSGPTGLRLEVRRNPDLSDPRYGGAEFLTGALTTETSFAQRYGYFEAKITAPKTEGLWPAFWLYDAPVADRRPLPPFGTPGAAQTRNWGDNWSGGLNGEIDVVEIMTNTPFSSYHTASPRYRWSDGAGGERTKLAIPSQHVERHNDTPASSAHIYGVLWLPDIIRWYRDDRLVAEAPNLGLHGQMYMIISMGTGGWSGNKPMPDFVSATMKVEYVRAYRVAGVDSSDK